MRSFSFVILYCGFAVELIGGARLIAPQSPTPLMQIEACGEIKPIQCTQQRIGEIDGTDCASENNQYFDFWDPIESPGQTATFTVRAQGHDIFITVQRWSDGEVLTFRNALNEVSLSYEMTSTDVVVGIGYLGSNDFGSYTLEMTCGNQPPDTGTDCPIEATVTCGQIVQSSLRSSNDCWFPDYYTHLYEIDAVQGQRIVVSSSMNVPSYLELQDEDSTHGIWAQGQRDEELSLTVRKSGVQYIVVSTYDQNTVANYDIRIDCYWSPRRLVNRR